MLLGLRTLAGFHDSTDLYVSVDLTYSKLCLYTYLATMHHSDYLSIESLCTSAFKHSVSQTHNLIFCTQSCSTHLYISTHSVVRSTNRKPLSGLVQLDHSRIYKTHPVGPLYIFMALVSLDHYAFTTLVLLDNFHFYGTHPVGPLYATHLVGQLYAFIAFVPLNHFRLYDTHPIG